MASVPLPQPLDLVRFGVHYPLGSESHDRGHPTHTHTHTPVNQHRQSPNSSGRELVSPVGSDSPSSLPTSAPSHQTSFGLEPSDPGLTPDSGSLPHSSPPVLTWQDPPIKREVNFAHPFSNPYSAPPQYRPEMSNDAAYPRAGPYYMPVGPMNPMDTSGRDLMYDQRKRAEDQIRREREIAKSRRHVCPVCDKRFNRPSSLNTHMSVHTGAKPYQCTREGCGRRFSVSSNLRRHERTHEARARPLPKQQTGRTAPTVSYSSPVQPTVFVHAPAPPPNISYPYTYHHPSTNPHSMSPSLTMGGGNMGGGSMGGGGHRYPYTLGGSLPAPASRDYHHPSLVHHRDLPTASNGGGGHSQSVTPPAQQSILMPQPTKNNTLMLG